MKQTAQKFTKRVILTNEDGLHMRPATMIYECAAKFQSEVELEANGRVVGTHSVMELLLLAAIKGTVITVSAEGPDCEDAVNTIVDLISSEFPY